MNEAEMAQTHHDTARALAEMDERIARFGELEPNWDSYGAKAISPTAMAVARDVLRAMIQKPVPTIDEGVLAVWIAPLPNGGVLLEWHGPTADLDIEVTATGALDLLLEERVGQTSRVSERADVDVAEIASVLGGVLAA